MKINLSSSNQSQSIINYFNEQWMDSIEIALVHKKDYSPGIRKFRPDRESIPNRTHRSSRCS